MKVTPLFWAWAACALCAGCFDNQRRPPDATPVTSLAALAATNRAEVARLYLRGGAEPLEKGCFAGLTGLRQLDLSERKLAAIPEEIWTLPALEHLYLAWTGLNALPDRSVSSAPAKIPSFINPTRKSVPLADLYSSVLKLYLLSLSVNS